MVVFALKVVEDWKPFRGDAPHCDYEVSPASPWNVVVELNPAWPQPSLAVARVPGRGAMRSRRRARR